MAVNDLKEFHTANLQDNKSHYTYFVQFTKGKMANYA